MTADPSYFQAAVDLALRALKQMDATAHANRNPKTGWRSDELCDAYQRLHAAPDLLAAILNSDNAHWTTAMRAAIAKATAAP